MTDNTKEPVKKIPITSPTNINTNNKTKKTNSQASFTFENRLMMKPLDQVKVAHGRRRRRRRRRRRGNEMRPQSERKNRRRKHFNSSCG